MNIKNFIQKYKIILLIALVITIAVVIVFTFKPFQKKQLTEKEKELNTLFKGKSVMTAELGQTINLGPLEITAKDFKESFYLSLEVDENYQRIKKNYLQIHAKVFNPSNDRTVQIAIGLTDDKGGQYKLDHMVPVYVPGLKDFGRNMTIWPRIIQEGELFFVDVNPEAKKFKLIFADTETKEKVTFEFSR